MPLRIAFVTLGYPPEHGSGLAVSSRRLVQELLNAGHKVTVVAAAHSTVSETHHHPSLTIIRLRWGRSDWIAYAARAAQFLQHLVVAQRIDIVHFAEVHFAYAYRGRFVAQLHHSFRQRLTITKSSYLGIGIQPLYYQLARVLTEQPALRRADGLLAASNATQDEYINAYGVSPERIALVRYGFDTKQFRPDQEASRRLRQRLGIAEDELVVLFVGFVTRRKGLEYLAQALPLIHPSPRLVIAGRWSDAYRTEFVNRLGSQGNRLIEAGFVTDSALPTYYAMADVYVSPSLLEGFGLTIAEALACSTPVVAAKGGSVAEVVGPGGLVVPAADPQALATGIHSLLADPVYRHELGRRGRIHIEQNFSVEMMRSAVLEAYRRFGSPVPYPGAH